MTYNGQSGYPGRGGNLDMTAIQQEIDSLGITGAKYKYQLIERTTTTEADVHYSYSLNQYLNKPLLQQDYQSFQMVLQQSWKKAFIGELLELIASRFVISNAIFY